MTQDVQIEIERLRAVSAMEIADVSALLIIVSKLEEFVRREHPELPDLQAIFLGTRKVFVQHQLEDMEKDDPALAARLQQIIDQSAKFYPYDYE